LYYYFILNSQELKALKAYSTLRIARNDAKLVGIRAKRLKDGKKDDDAPPKASAGDD
jgi:hypothetical protein